MTGLEETDLADGRQPADAEREAALLFTIRSMTMADYPAVVALWQATEGMGLSRADTPEAIGRYLAGRNPGLSAVAVSASGEVAGALLCGHDGRRGLLHHLAVHRDYRRRGLGRALVNHCLAGLQNEGIDRCHLLVFTDNQPAGIFGRRTAGLSVLNWCSCRWIRGKHQEP